MRLSVDMICGSYPPEHCGVADYTRMLVRELRKQEVDARVITSMGRYVNIDSDVPADGLCDNWTVSGVQKLSEVLQQRNADIVHIQFPTQPYHGHWGINFLPMWMQPKPVITTLHEYCMAPSGGRLKQLLTAWKSEKIIVTQDYDRALLGRWMDDSRIRTIPIGSNILVTGTVEEGRRMLGSISSEVSNSPILLFFGFVRPAKGLESLLHALAILRDINVFLVIVSPEADSDYQNKLTKLAADLGVSSRIYSTGYLNNSEVSSLMLAASAAVLPFEDGASFRRGSLLAAMTHGMSVVSTKTRMTPADFRHQENIMLGAVNDSSAIAENVKSIIQQEPLSARISNGALVLSQTFAWPQIASETKELYESVLRNNIRK